jgi:hypothetical protein
MANQLNAAVLGVQKSLLTHGEVALALAKTTETSGKVLSKEDSHHCLQALFQQMKRPLVRVYGLSPIYIILN